MADQNPTQNTLGESEPESEAERREKLFHLKNRLSRQPGDPGLIKEYVDLVLDSTSREDPADRLETYGQIESFLLERAGDVEPGEVDALLEMASSLDERREEALQQSEPDVQMYEEDRKVVDTYRDWRESGVDTTMPGDPEETGRKLSLCKKVNALVRDRGKESLDGLESLIDRLQTASQVDESLNRAEQMIESANEEANHSQATYLLQSAEQIISQLVTRRGDLDEARRSKIKSKIREIEDLSKRVSKKQKEERDERRLEEFLDTHGEEFKELDAWDIYGNWYRFKDKYRAKTKKEPRDSSPFTSKIQQLEEMLRVLSKLAESMSTEAGLEQVEPRLEAMDVKVEYTRKRREQTYNEFAMTRIRACLSEAEDATGAWNNKEKIADQLVKYLAEVDQRYLTSEVGRCYSEAFEYLYGKLKRAKSKDDFQEEGRKLNVLKRMHEAETIGIEAF